MNFFDRTYSSLTLYFKTMAKKLQDIAIVLLAILILITSVGISVNQHVCLSKDMYEVSLFPIEKCESIPVAPHSCCAASKNGACFSDFSNDGTKHTKEKKSCCSYDSEYVVLTTDLVPPTVSLKLAQQFYFHIAPLLGFIKSSLDFYSANSILPKFALKPPLPATEQHYCSFLQVFIC